METVRFAVVDPGHYHAALILKDMYPQVAPQVAVYAPLGAELVDFVNRVSLFNARVQNPTHWELAGVYSKAEQCSGKALILGEFTWAGGYYRRGVLRRLSRPSASARLCWTRVCFDKTVATRGGPFSPCGG